MARQPEGNRDWFGDTDIRTSLMTLEELFQSGIFGSRSMAVLMAGVTQSLILLNDLLQKASGDGVRVTFNDDIEQEWGADVTDFINKMRNAVCHIPSGLRNFAGGRLAFNVIWGLNPNAMNIGGTRIGCDYPDDIAINYGGMRLYLMRHLHRAYLEVSQRLMPLVEAREAERREALLRQARGERPA